ncbi:MAG TPA: hypothetical protein VLX28_20490 [Thermoanaerobaculia bacterium]|nr:hypothetical protein [Thermoanaerobaculia bacterium]
METWRAMLRGADSLLDELVAGRRLLHHWLRLCLGMAACSGVYGAVLGGWHGPRLAVYSAIKLPLVLLVTSALTVAFSWIAAALLGLRLRFGQVAVLTFLALAAGSLLLVSLAPVAWIFTVCSPPPSNQARTAHNVLYLLHTGFVGGCGIAGTATLWKALVRLELTPFDQSRRTLRAVYAVWVAAFALVGGEVAWALRPFVGSIYMPVHFLRADALAGNVYEFIFTDIVPHLLSRL